MSSHLRYTTLASSDQRAADNREEYALRLIDIIKEHVTAEYVSIFYRDNARERLECLASTGLWAQDGSKIPGETPFRATYEPNEGLTGMTFASGELAVRRTHDETRLHAQKYRELPPTSKGTSAPCVIYPILLSRKPALDEPAQRRAVG